MRVVIAVEHLSFSEWSLGRRRGQVLSDDLNGPDDDMYNDLYQDNDTPVHSFHRWCIHELLSQLITCIFPALWNNLNSFSIIRW